MTDDDVQRSIGRLEGRLDTQDRLLVDIRAEMHALTEYMNQTKGTWRILMVLGGAASALGAAVSEVVHWVRGP